MILRRCGWCQRDRERSGFRLLGPLMTMRRWTCYDCRIIVEAMEHKARVGVFATLNDIGEKWRRDRATADLLDAVPYGLVPKFKYDHGGINPAIDLGIPESGRKDG